LGLYDAEGSLHHIGVAASFTDKKRRELVELLEPHRKDALKDHPWREWAGHDHHEEGQRMPGAKSRWSQNKDLSWQPLRVTPDEGLVAEVGFDHLQGTRLRHTAHFRRWRPDKRPRDCDYAQLDVVPPQEIKDLFPS
jgi:ATP-dependent DNA ligase